MFVSIWRHGSKNDLSTITILLILILLSTLYLYMYLSSKTLKNQKPVFIKNALNNINS